jgi:hypothetical protein
MDRQSGFRGNTGHIVVREKGCKDASLLQVIVQGVFYPDESGALRAMRGIATRMRRYAPNAA